MQVLAEKGLYMKEYDATEEAYKNGYQQGRLDGIKELSSRLKRYYGNLSGTTSGVSVSYFVEVVSKEMEVNNDASV